MNLRAKIAVVAASVFLAGCREMPGYFASDTTLARAGGKQLQLRDVESVVPKGVTGEDSAAFMKVYVDRWVRKQLKLKEAETLFSASGDDIDKMVEEYRQALLIRKDSITFEKAALLYSDDATSKMNGGIVSNHDILERFSAFDAKLTVTKFLREDFAHFNALNDYNALVRLKPGEVSEAFLTEDIMGNQLAKVVKLVEIIPTHVASLNEDYLRLEEMALNAKQEKVFKDWLSKKIDAMYVYIDPEFRDGAFENKHWVK